MVHAARHANEWRAPFPEGEDIQFTGGAGLFLPSLFHDPTINEMRERAAAIVMPHLQSAHRYVTMVLAQPSIQFPSTGGGRTTAGKPHRETERTPLPTRHPDCRHVGYTGFVNLSSVAYCMWVAPDSHDWSDPVGEWSDDARWIEQGVRIRVEPGEILLLDQRVVRLHPSEVRKRDRIFLYLAFVAGDEPPPSEVVETTRHLIEQGDIPPRLPNGAQRNIFAAVTHVKMQEAVVRYAQRLKRRCTHRADWRLGAYIRSCRVPLASLPSLRMRKVPVPSYTESQLKLLGLVRSGGTSAEANAEANAEASEREEGREEGSERATPNP